MKLTNFRRFVLIPAVAVLAVATTMVAQGPRERGPGGPGGPRGIERIAAELSLTDAQKTQIQTILENQKTSMAPFQAQLQTLQTSITAAVKANNKAQIDSLAIQLGALQGQVATVRLENEAAIYALLTADQKTKADTLFPNGLPFGGGFGGPGGPRPPRN